MTLQELRQRVSGLTQTQIADLMKVTQGAISQLERRHDVLLSELAAYAQALGGELELIAGFPDADVRITQFDTDDETLHRGQRRGSPRGPPPVGGATSAGSCAMCFYQRAPATNPCRARREARSRVAR
jgi:transcriptional regulator with XRE-family HTH domain